MNRHPYHCCSPFLRPPCRASQPYETTVLGEVISRLRLSSPDVHSTHKSGGSIPQNHEGRARSIKRRFVFASKGVVFPRAEELSWKQGVAVRDTSIDYQPER
nr:hypothetical protein CFP56_53353 [Quercus suber]